MHEILMKDNYKSIVEHNKRLNPNMKEVVWAEVLKLLDVGMIYPISNSLWVSRMQLVPKKGKMYDCNQEWKQWAYSNKNYN